MEIRLLSIRQVRVIDAISKTRGFDLAAHQLNMSQSVVSRCVSEAEAQLGEAIFQRGWSGTELTRKGEAVLKRCSVSLDMIARAESDIEAQSGTRPRLVNFLRWHHLDAVSAVARFGSASLASKHLGVSQPAISRSIAAISAYCNQPIFDRKRNGLTALPQATRLVLLRGELLQQLGTLRRLDVGLDKPGLVGRLAVGMLPFSGQDLVAKVFGTLTTKHPDLRLMAVPGSYIMLAEALRRGEIDCIMGILRDPAPYSDLTEISLYQEGFALVARWDHPCHAKPQSIPVLKAEKWIVAPHGTPIRAYFERLFQDSGAAPPAQTCEILSFGHAEEVIINSNSIGLLSYSRAHLARLPPELKRVEIELPHAETSIGLTVKKTNGLSETIKIFEALLHESIDKGL